MNKILMSAIHRIKQATHYKPEKDGFIWLPMELEELKSIIEFHEEAIAQVIKDVQKFIETCHIDYPTTNNQQKLDMMIGVETFLRIIDKWLEQYGKDKGVGQK